MHAESLKSQTVRKSLQHNPAASRASPCFPPCAGYLPSSPEAPLSNFSFLLCLVAFQHVLVFTSLFKNNLILMLCLDSSISACFVNSEHCQSLSPSEPMEDRTSEPPTGETRTC